MKTSNSKPAALIALEGILRDHGLLEGDADWVDRPTPHWSYRHKSRTAMVALPGSDGSVTLRFRDAPSQLESDGRLTRCNDYFARNLGDHKWAILLSLGWQKDTDFAPFLNSVLHHAYGRSDLQIEPPRLPEEVPISQQLWEGAVRIVRVNAYERNAVARQACLDHWGTRCCVCGFDFEAVYGDLGAGYIHVHHLVPLAEIAEEYEVNPIEDLRPVCPNCHAMIHRREPPLSPQDLQAMILPSPTYVIRP